MNKKADCCHLSLTKILWDLWCISSVIGIWPRFIEPRMISTTHLTLPLPNISPDLEGLKILQFSDLHFHSKVSDSFYKRLADKVKKLNPDVICFTGDFLCYGLIDDPLRLQQLLRSFNAPYGCYAVLGNHDYQEYVSIGENGDYDVINSDISTQRKGWKRLLTTTLVTGKKSSRIASVQLNEQLMKLMESQPFELLNNETKRIRIKDSYLNICGLEEYMLGRCRPEKAFLNYSKDDPGIVLVHNPDSLPSLIKYPGDIVLCGHTHGGQVNLPGLCKKFMLAEHQELKRGLHHFNGKKVYINRGIGSVMPFRWFSIPELLLLTLKRKTL